MTGVPDDHGDPEIDAKADEEAEGFGNISVARLDHDVTQEERDANKGEEAREAAVKRLGGGVVCGDEAQLATMRRQGKTQESGDDAWQENDPVNCLKGKSSGNRIENRDLADSEGDDCKNDQPAKIKRGTCGDQFDSFKEAVGRVALDFLPAGGE